MKQATLKKFRFTRRVGHIGEKVNVDIPAYVEDTGILCPNCSLIVTNEHWDHIKHHVKHQALYKELYAQFTEVRS